MENLYDLEERHPRVLTIEPFHTGHHGIYLEWILRAVETSGFLPEVASTLQSVKHFENAVEPTFPESTRWVPNLHLDVSTSGAYSVFSLLRASNVFWKFCRNSYEEASSLEKPKAVILPYADTVLYSLALLGSPFGGVPFCCIVMRPSFHLNKQGLKAPRHLIKDSIKQRLFFRFLRIPTLQKCLVIDPYLREYVSFIDPKLAKKIQYLPEPISMPSTCLDTDLKAVLGISKSDRVILVYGSIDWRKSLDVLLDATMDEDFPKDTHIVVAGEQTAGARSHLESAAARQLYKQKRLHVIPRFVGKSEEKALFLIADAVWLCYRNHYSASGVLARAAAFNTPVIASDLGLLGGLTKRYDLGRVADVNSMSDVLTAINMVFNRQETMRTKTNLRDAQIWCTVNEAGRLLMNGLVERNEARITA